eukprot:15454530-Alexandrium_andersonii.AAC.1
MGCRRFSWLSWIGLAGSAARECCHRRWYCRTAGRWIPQRPLRRWLGMTLWVGRLLVWVWPPPLQRAMLG